ncbi:MAG TPA: hypothetical protein VI895_04965 [Bdellovibrionota bacterium]|nr:hypothetical protein [Bdellovibrionota bacterium]
MEFRIEIVGDRVACKQDGGEAFAVALKDFIDAVEDHGDCVALSEAIPDGVSFIRRRGDVVVLAVEEKPTLRTVRWLADESPVPYGKGAIYRQATLAFPFVVIVAALRCGALTGYQQCFFRTSSLRYLSDPLFCPNLYNVAEAYGMKCWLCLVGLKKNLAALHWQEKINEIRAHLWGSSFNRSSEVNEGNSYWQTMRKIDPRVATLQTWEEESRRDRAFPLKIRWQPAGKSVGQVMDEMLAVLAPARPLCSVAELVQLLNLCASRRRSWLAPFKK